MNVQETSVIAYYRAVQTLGNRQIEVFKKLGELGSATNSELSQYLDKPINTITPRVKELRDKGLVKERERRTCSITGMNAIAWELVKLN